MKSTIIETRERKESISCDGSDFINYPHPEGFGGLKKKKPGIVTSFLRKKFSGSETNLHTTSASSNNLNYVGHSHQSSPSISTSSSNLSKSNSFSSSRGSPAIGNHVPSNILHNSNSNGILTVSKIINPEPTPSISVKVGTPNTKKGLTSSSPLTHSTSNSNSNSNSNNSNNSSSGSSSSSSYLSSNHLSRSSSSTSLSDSGSESPLSESAELFISSIHRLSRSTSTTGKRMKSISQDKDNHNGVTLISIIPSTNYSWEVPQGLTLESIKQQALQDIEYILVMLSECQKTLAEKSKSSFIMDESYADMDMFDRKCKIRNKVAVMTEILKQFNFGRESSDVDHEFDTLTGGDEIERKTFLLARKTMNLKLEINKASSIKRVHVLNTIIQFIAKFLKTNLCPTEVPAIPLEMTITMEQGSGVQQYLGSTVYKKGSLLKKKNRSLGSKFSSKWIVLKHSEMLIYASEKEDRLLGRKSISDMASISITPMPKEGYPHCFTLSFVETDGANMGAEGQEEWATNTMRSLNSSGSKQSKSRCNLLFSAESNESLVQWILAIDGVSHSNFKSVMDLLVKEQLLSTFKSCYKGGIFRYGDEEWHYHDGKLTNQTWGDMIEYEWDGCKLTPSKNSQHSLGHGRWNGVWLTWHGDSSKETYLKYLYQPAQRNYIVDSYPLRQQFTWTWSRHFLVSASGGEWICEGDVPPVLVMLVQMMKYYRVGR